MFDFFLSWSPSLWGRQSRRPSWTYKLRGGRKFSIKLSPLSVGFPQRRPLNLIKWPQFINSQQEPRAHKNKIGAPPPPQKKKPKYPPPPKTRHFMGMGFSCRKNAFFQAPIKLAQPFGPLRTLKGFFWSFPRGAIYEPPCVQLINNPFLLYIKFLHC